MKVWTHLWVFLLSFIGQALSLYFITVSTSKLPDELVGQWAIIDGYVYFFMAFLSFGLQLRVSRDVAFGNKGIRSFLDAQKARITLSIMALCFAVIYILFSGFSVQKMVYVLLPLVALNGDYVLYGLGKPILATAFSVLRALLPAAGIYLMYLEILPENHIVYLFAFMIAFGLAGTITSFVTKTRYISLPSINSLILYRENINLGLYQTMTPFMISGIFIIAAPLYSLPYLALLYPMFKWVEMFKGGLKLYNQTNYPQFTNPKNAALFDRIALLGTGTLVILLLIAAPVIISHFDISLTSSEVLNVKLLLCWLLTMSFKATTEIQMVFQKKERKLAVYYFSGVLVAIAALILLRFTQWNTFGIPASLFIGEVFLLVSLGYQTESWAYFKRRRLSLIIYSLVLLLLYLA